jgi:hypothetical protein
MSSWPCSFRMRHVVRQNIRSTPDNKTWTHHTHSSWRLTYHSSLGEKTRLRQTIGSTLLSQSSTCFTVQSIRRLCMSLSSSEVHQGLVAIIHSHTSSRSPCAMGWVPHRFPWPPPVSEHNAAQAYIVFESTPGEPLCLWVHPGVQQPSTVRGSPCWYW